MDSTARIAQGLKEDEEVEKTTLSETLNTVLARYIAVGGVHGKVPRYKWECDISGDCHEPKSRPSFPARCEQ